MILQEVLCLIDEFYANIDINLRQAFKEQIRNIRKSGSLFKIHYETSERTYLFGTFGQLIKGSVHINYWHGLDFLNIHFHPSLDKGLHEYVEKPSLFDKYNIIEFDITGLKGVINIPGVAYRRLFKERNGYGYWINVDVARQILRDFKLDIQTSVKYNLIDEDCRGQITDWKKLAALDCWFYADGSHRIEGYSTEELNNRLWKLSGLSRPLNVTLKDADGITEGIQGEDDDKPHIINQTSSYEDLNSSYIQYPFDPYTQASCSYLVKDTINTSSYDEVSNVNEKTSSPSGSSSLEAIDWNNVPSWLNNKLSKHFRETGNRTIEIEKLKNIFSHEMLSGTLSKDDIIDIQNYYVCLFNEGSDYSVAETNDKSRSGNLGSFVGSVGSNLDQPLNLLGKSVLSASSKALEKSSTLAGASERAYNLAYGAYNFN
jgi:hypothetical protein